MSPEFQEGVSASTASKIKSTRRLLLHFPIPCRLFLWFAMHEDYLPIAFFQRNAITKKEVAVSTMAAPEAMLR